MKDNLSFVLVLLIATTSLNHGEKLKAPNNKRCGGMVVRPRSGRSSGMTEFTRIDRASGLMAFPRVGRSDSSDYEQVFDFNSDDISEVKRQGLIPYPRVGRSDESLGCSNKVVRLHEIKRAGDAVPNGGMWFGPRLGRLQRRGDEQQAMNDGQQWAVFPLREFSSPGGQMQSDDFTPRLGHDSDTDDGQSTLNTGALY